MADQNINSKEIIIKLTDEERRQIKRVTGEDITELRLGTIEACVKPLDADYLETEYTGSIKRSLRRALRSGH